MVRVGLVSDTHGYLDERIAAALGHCQWIVHAGDVGADAVLERLRQCGGELVAVKGNNDTRQKWLGTFDPGHLPEEVRLPLPGGDLVVVHGHRAGSAARRHDTLRRRYGGARAVVYGHSHRLVLDDGAQPWVLNPGAAGRARTFGGPSYMVLHAAPGHWRVEAERLPPQKGPRKC